MPNGTTVVAAAQETARARLTTVDDFVANQTPFDRQSRLCLPATVATVTEAMYLAYVGAQAMDWQAEQITALQAIVASIATKFAGLQVTLPPTVAIVQTSGKEEGAAAYTRGLDTIVLPANMVGSIAFPADFGDPLHAVDSTDYLANVVIHEFFHLISKNNPALRTQLYGQIAYQVLPNSIELPRTPWPGAGGEPMRDLKITNPDGVFYDVAIELLVPPPGPAGQPGVHQMLTPVLLASGPYQRGTFFDSLQWWFIAVAETGRGWAPVLHQGQPVMYESTPLMAQYLALVGSNFTNEIFYPDEILAQTFVLAINQPSVGDIATVRNTLVHT